jgi:thioredoxin reductase (NADPH)
VHTHRRVTEVSRVDSGFQLQIQPTAGDPQANDPATRETILAENVVLAIGEMHRPRLLEIPGEDLPHVSHYFDDPHRYFHHDLLIVGGRNSAVEAALRCHRAGARVHLSYRRAKFVETSVKYWLLPDLRNQIRAGCIEYSPETIPLAIDRESVQLRHEPSGEERTVRADFVLLLTGYEQDTTLFDQTGVRLEGVNEQPVINLETMETEVPGLYVAGTAVAGTQIDFKLFIENSHPHVRRIVRAITGEDPPFDTGDTSRISSDLPES